MDIDSFDGGGAAGGIGAVLIGILHANMISGIELLLSFSDMEEQVKDCDLVITGEGQSDRQTMFGKVPVGILKLPTAIISHVSVSAVPWESDIRSFMILDLSEYTV